MLKNAEPSRQVIREDQTPRRGVREDVIAGLAVIAIGSTFLVNSESGYDWVFPVSISYLFLGFGVWFVVRGLLGIGSVRVRMPSLVAPGPARDVLFFMLLAIAYGMLLSTVGFWPMTFLALLTGPLYLTGMKTLKRDLLSIGAVALGFCVVGYIIFEIIFYIPLPRGALLPL